MPLNSSHDTNDTNDINESIDNGEKTKLILDTIRENPSVTLNEIAISTSLSRSTVARILKVLKQLGAIKRIGSTRGYWEIMVG